jgi:putative ABC transport system ATP-binding protein
MTDVRNTADVGPTKARAYSVRALTKVYETSGGRVHALRGINLDLFDGEIIVLLGPSGSGKSTLLSLLGGLDRPSAGQIWFGDGELTSLDDRALTAYRRRHVGFVFQFYNLIPSLTVRENVELATEMADRPVAPTDALDLVGLAQRMDHFPAQLSGGEQQRVAIARAITKRPAVLLCDEPTGAVDSKTGARVLEAIERCNLEFGTVTVLVTHNTVIAGMGDRVLSLTDGALAGERTNALRRKARELSW